MISLNPLNWFQKKDYTLADPRLIDILGGTTTATGLSVGPHTALKVTAFNAAVRVIAETFASLPLNVIVHNGSASTVDVEHSLFRLVHDEPNEWSSSYDLRFQMQVDCLLHGNAYAFVNRVNGSVREIIRLQPSRN